MRKKELIKTLLATAMPDECMLVNDLILDELIDDYYRGNKDAPENYKSSGEGFDYDIYELVVLIFAGIQALDALPGTVEKVVGLWTEKKGLPKDRGELNQLIRKALLDNGVEEKDVDKYCEDIAQEMAQDRVGNQ